jgi:hypothetical protein
VSGARLLEELLPRWEATPLQASFAFAIHVESATFLDEPFVLEDENEKRQCKAPYSAA